MGSIPYKNEWLQHFRTCSPEEISQLVSKEIPQDRLPTQYLESLSEEDKTVCFRACMICWAVTERAMVPREMQLRTVLGKHCLLRYAFSLTIRQTTSSLSRSLLSNDCRSPKSLISTLALESQPL